MEKDLTLRVPTDLEQFDLFWQSEDGWAAFWDLLRDSDSKAADWKRAVERAFCVGFGLGQLHPHKRD